MTARAHAADGGRATPASRLVAILDWLVRAEGLAALAALSTPPALALGAALYSSLNERPLLALGLFGLATHLFAIVVVMVVVRRLGDRLAPHSAHARTARGAVPHQYRMESIDVSYRIDPADPRHHTMTSRETVVAECDGLKHLPGEVFWSGSGNQEMPAITGDPDVTIFVRDPHHPLEDFRIFFGGDEGLQAGESRSYELSADLYDEEGTFKPFLNQAIRVPTGRLELVLALPHEDFPTVYAQVRESGDPAPRPLDEGLAIRPELGIACLTVDRPAVGAKYSLRWFPHGDQPPAAEPAEASAGEGPAALDRANGGV